MNAFGEYFRQDDSTPSKKQTNKQKKTQKEQLVKRGPDKRNLLINCT